MSIGISIPNTSHAKLKCLLSQPTLVKDQGFQFSLNTISISNFFIRLQPCNLLTLKDMVLEHCLCCFLFYFILFCVTKEQNVFLWVVQNLWLLLSLFLKGKKSNLFGTHQFWVWMMKLLMGPFQVYDFKHQRIFFSPF